MFSDVLKAGDSFLGGVLDPGWAAHPSQPKILKTQDSVVLFHAKKTPASGKWRCRSAKPPATEGRGVHKVEWAVKDEVSGFAEDTKLGLTGAVHVIDQYSEHGHGIVTLPEGASFDSKTHTWLMRKKEQQAQSRQQQAQKTLARLQADAHEKKLASGPLPTPTKFGVNAMPPVVVRRPHAPLLASWFGCCGEAGCTATEDVAAGEAPLAGSLDGSTGHYSHTTPVYAPGVTRTVVKPA
jgi:hypothetical protein